MKKKATNKAVISQLVGIMRHIPWIVENQNQDGSWGDDADRDTSTLAVVRALLSVRELLPAGLRP